MSTVLCIQLCSQYMDKFGCNPNPTQLLAFARGRGVKLMYKHCAQTLKSHNKKNERNNDGIIKSPKNQKSEPIINKYNPVLVNDTQTVSLECTKSILNDDYNSQIINNGANAGEVERVVQEMDGINHTLSINNDAKQVDTKTEETVGSECMESTLDITGINLVDDIKKDTNDDKMIVDNDDDVAVVEAVTSLQKTQKANSIDVKEGNKSLLYKIIVSRKSCLDIIIYIDPSTPIYSFGDYHKYLRDHFHLMVTRRSYFDPKDNMMVHFSPICHRLKTNLIEQQLSDTRINIIVFGFIRNTSLIYIPTDIALLIVSYLNDGDNKFTTTTHYEMQKPTQIYKYGLISQLQKWYLNPVSLKNDSQRNTYTKMKISTEYHSKYAFQSGYKKVCNACILPLKMGSISGIASCCIDGKEDIIDETIKYFRANVFKKTFEIKSSADLPLIYLTVFIGFCLRKLKDIKTKTDAMECKFYRDELNQNVIRWFKCPGDDTFAFTNKCHSFTKPKTLKEKYTFVQYFKQLRGETLKRFVHICYYSNGLQNKHWFQFSRRKFLNINEL